MIEMWAETHHHLNQNQYWLVARINNQSAYVSEYSAIDPNPTQQLSVLRNLCTKLCDKMELLIVQSTKED